jgi:hypothetical protein
MIVNTSSSTHQLVIKDYANTVTYGTLAVGERAIVYSDGASFFLNKL